MMNKPEEGTDEVEMKELNVEEDEKVERSRERKCCPDFQPLHQLRDAAVHIRRGCHDMDCRGQIKRTCTVELLKKKLPITKWLPSYRFRELRGDLIAGLTLGLTVIPQSMAYAKIAELPAQYGLYTSFVCYFAYCFFGTARDVNLGPTAVLSLLTAEFTHQIPQLASLLALICGVVQIIMGILNIGIVMEFISHTIINSFTTAAALAIIFSQVKKWLGLKGVPRDFARQLYWTILKIPETQLWDCSLGLVCMIFLYLLKKLKTIKFKNAKVADVVNFISTARNAIAIFIASTVAAILFSQECSPFTLTGNITSGVPSLSLPTFYINHGENITLTPTESFQKLGIGSVITPLVGLIEVIAIGKAFGKKNGYRIDSNQEFLALGVSNILGSFVSAYPVTGSFSRSAVASQSGIQTPAANILTGVLVLLALAFLTPMFYYIPTSGLAAVIIMAVTDLVDFSIIKQLWIINKAELVPWFSTFVISLLFGFEYGILIGVAVSLIFLLHPWAKPDVMIVPLESTNLKHQSTESENAPVENEIEKTENILVVSLSMGLMFPGGENFEEKVCEEVNHESLIFDFSQVTKMDFSAASCMKQLANDLTKKNIKFVFINLSGLVQEKLEKSKIKGFKKADSMEQAIQLLSAVPQKKEVVVILEDDRVEFKSGAIEDKHTFNEATQSNNSVQQDVQNKTNDKQVEQSNENKWLLQK